MTTFIAAAAIFFAFAVALSLGALLGGRKLEGTSCSRRQSVMGKAEGECCGAHKTCCHEAETTPS